MATGASPSSARTLDGPVMPVEWARLIRVHQWSKNLLVFLPLATGHAYDDPRAVAACLLGFLSLSLVASGAYLANDIADAGSDRCHPTKRLRPVASGRVGVRAAACAAVGLVALGLLLASYATPGFLAMTAAYLLGSLAYTAFLRRQAMVDVVAVGLLFTLRVAAGSEVSSLPQSPWLLSFSALFFLSLALAKRHAEVHAAHRGVLTMSGRGYRPEDWPLTLGVGIASLFSALVVLVVYLTEEAVRTEAYARPAMLWAVPVLVSTWSLRIWLLSHRGELRGDPVSFALRDRASLATVALVLLAYAAASA